jgi:hypothetical protein
MNRVAACGMLSALSLLAACSSTGPEASEPPPLASLLATPNPTPKPPKVAAITKAVQTFVEGLNTAFRTGDVSAAIAASDASCSCRKEIANIAAIYSKNEHFVGTHLVLLRIVPTTSTVDGAQAKVTFRVPASAIALPNGKRKQLKAIPAHVVVVALTMNNGRLVVSSFGGLPHPSASGSPSPGASASPRPSPSPS